MGRDRGPGDYQFRPNLVRPSIAYPPGFGSEPPPEPPEPPPEPEVPPIIAATAISSAGIFDSTGKLVRTLWSATLNHPNANDPEAFWDGTIDDPIRTLSKNLFPFSQEFDSWFEWQSDTTADVAVAPDSTMTADLIEPNIPASSGGAENWHTIPIGVVPGTHYTMSVYAKPNALMQWFTMQFTPFGTAGAGAAFDIVNGIVGVDITFGGGVVLSKSMSNEGNGWYRCVVTFTTPVTSAGALFFISDSNSNGPSPVGSSMYLWGAQLEEGDSVTSYEATGESTVISSTRVATTGDYTVKVLWHEANYVWEGVIGNTSPDHTTLFYHHYACVILDMAIDAATGEMYFTTSYDERWQQMKVGLTSSPQEADVIGVWRGPANSIGSVCTDGTYVYFRQFELPNDNYVRVYDCADYHYSFDGFPGRFDTLEVGQKQQVLPAFGDAFGFIARTTGSFIWDIAVQKTGDFLFISRDEVDGNPNIYAIWVLDKTTGEVLQHNVSGLNQQRAICTSPTTNEAWIAHGTVEGIADLVTKLAVDISGNVTLTALQISGFTDVINLEISPDGSTLLVVDGGASQQVKAFNTSDGSVKAAWATSGVLGVAGGYAASPAVTDTKFMFEAHAGFSSEQVQAFAAYQADGSFWLSDVGNCRYLHFSSGNSPTVTERIMYLPSFYSCRVCNNDDTRVFADWLEFTVDYSLPLAIDNGSWELTNNWAYGVPNQDSYGKLKWVGTYSNNLTYAAVDDSGTRKIWEMTSSGWRDTGTTVYSDGSSSSMDREFNIWYATGGANSPAVFKKNTFAGFDGSENPTWGATSSAQPATTVLTSEILPPDFPPVECQFNHGHEIGATLSNGVSIVWNAHSSNGDAWESFHLGGIGDDGLVKFQTHYSAPFGHGNTFAPAPFFNISAGLGDFGGGNCVYKPGATSFFTSWPGENWGSNQNNIWYHWHESGLLIDYFGQLMPYFCHGDIQIQEFDERPIGGMYAVDPDIDIEVPYLQGGFSTSWKSLPGAAGNAFEGGIAEVNGKYYIYHNDEWYHGGLHRWRVDGLDTIETFDREITWDSGDYDGTPDPYDLLDGLPANTVGGLDLPDGTAGWTRSPAANISTTWQVRTSYINCDTHFPPDITMICALGDGTTASIQKDIPRSGTGDWTIDSIVELPTIAYGNYSDAASTTHTHVLYIEVLDGTGKIITRIENSGVDIAGNSRSMMWINGAENNPITTPKGATGPWNNYTQALHPLVIAADVSANEMQITYGDYSISNIAPMEVGADITDPAVFRVRNLRAVGQTAQDSVTFTRLVFIE